ncbi:MAG TPA: nucleoside 2-deoxyribosyltransferase [Myxococcota bacterium]|nr:nucleoside 2-deoxyribosyltransferase [Myxococcota bacterium]
MTRPRVYLAGPEVFLPDPQRAAAAKKALCERHGFTGVFPLDAGLELGGLAPRDAALAIGRANEDLIRSCQHLVANLTPFRGPSADAGTVWELGFARGLGLRVHGYSNVARDFAARTRAFLRDHPDPLAVESFGLADNLMLAHAIEASGGAFVARSAPRAKRYTDLSAFEECLVTASRSA